MLNALVAFFSSLPEIIQLIRDVLTFLKEAKSREERRALAQKVSEGVHRAVHDKDTSKLEDLFRGR